MKMSRTTKSWELQTGSRILASLREGEDATVRVTTVEVSVYMTTRPPHTEENLNQSMNAWRRISEESR